jgi:hypothetical protein
MLEPFFGEKLWANLFFQKPFAQQLLPNMIPTNSINQAVKFVLLFLLKPE